jgi:myosin-7
MIKERIGLPASSQGFSLFEVFGALERNMLSWEKARDPSLIESLLTQVGV